VACKKEKQFLLNTTNWCNCPNIKDYWISGLPIYLHSAASLRTLRYFNSQDVFVSVITKATGCTLAETRTFSTNGCAVWNALQCSIHHPILSVSTPTIYMLNSSDLSSYPFIKLLVYPQYCHSAASLLTLCSYDTHDVFVSPTLRNLAENRSFSTNEPALWNANPFSIHPPILSGSIPIYVSLLQNKFVSRGT